MSADQKPVQNFANHTKFVPAFHFFLLPVLLANLVQSILDWRHELWSVGGAIWVLTSVALILGALLARMFALSVQDRVIRLEEQLRYLRVLPADLQPRASELSVGQIVSLRFASDGELPGLVRRVLDEKLEDRKAIKRLIQNWRADYLRA
jgi:Family of unknown function (DUF6526)